MPVIHAAFDVPNSVLHGIFVTAMEGGINHWATVSAYRWSVVLDGTAQEDHEGFCARIVDRGPAMPTRHRVDRETILRGLTKALSADPGVADRIVRDARREVVLGDPVYLDAEGADAIVQLGLFNEVVYG